MNFGETITIITEEKVADGCGGFVSQETTVGTLRVKVAPYRVQIGDIIQVPNPTSSVKFFTNQKLPFDEDTPFFIIYKDKKYKKIVIADYGKVIMIVGERV